MNISQGWKISAVFIYYCGDCHVGGECKEGYDFEWNENKQRD
jgi:hypothetical protein